MWKLADKNYATLHKNFVNGSPATTEICTLNCNDAATAVWKTILVGGLGGGGRGYYALDITNPNSPSLLWEFTTTAGIGVTKDDDLGYSYGNPIITRLLDTNNTWVVIVTSGYNNVNPGDGKGYLYVLNASTGAIISKISTAVGDTTTPSGLAKVAGYNLDPVGNSVGLIYGGDLLGNVWRFNVNDTTAAAIGTGSVMKFATLFSDAAATSPQPVTTTPVLGKISGKRVIFVGTGKYLETADLSNSQLQTQYAIQDDDATVTLVNPRTSLIQQTLANNSDGTATRLASSNVVNFYTDRGWYVNFPESGERVNIDSTLIQGALIVPSIVPSNTAC
jgi:type IV pilus assembly protein PilY1